MRLHNRQVKAEFWTDPDLLQLSRDARTFYHGLWHCSDDSACLEDSPFTLKLLLFPSPVDADITVEVMAGWIEDLISMRKIIRYEVSGKQYLYLTKFRKHQTLRNPGAPSTPLPPWVKWEDPREEKGKRVPGRYVLLYDPLEQSAPDAADTAENGTDAVPTRYQTDTDSASDSHRPHTCPKRKEKKLREDKGTEANAASATNAVPRSDCAAPDPKNPLADAVVVMDEVIAFWQQNIHVVITDYQVQSLYAYTDRGMEPACVLEALKRAVGQNKRTLSYVEGILRRWETDGVKTLEDIQALDQSREFERRNRNGYSDQDRPPPEEVPLSPERQRRSRELTRKIKAWTEKMEVPG